MMTFVFSFVLYRHSVSVPTHIDMILCVLSLRNKCCFDFMLDFNAIFVITHQMRPSCINFDVSRGVMLATDRVG